MSSIIATKRNRLVASGPERQKSLLRTNIMLLIVLLVMIFLLPVIPLEDHFLTKVALSLVVATGLFAAEFSRSLFRILFSIAILVIGVTVLSLFERNSDTLTYVSFLLVTAFFILITISLITHIAGAKNVESSTLICAVNSYLLIGLSLSLLFILMDMIAPNSFGQIASDGNRASAFIYYGFVTLTTLGYGDILPVTPLARSLAAFTALFGQLYLVIIMAFLIGKYLNAKNQES
jgi:voltage-gated potassium channel